MNRLFLKITVVSLLYNLNCFAMNDPHDPRNLAHRYGLPLDNLKTIEQVSTTLGQATVTLSETSKRLENIAIQTIATLDKITDKTFKVGFDNHSIQELSKELNTTVNNVQSNFNNSLDRLDVTLKNAHTDLIKTLDRIDAMDKEVAVTITNIGDANRFVKNTGICFVGLTGSSVGLFLLYKGLNKAFIDNDNKDDSNPNNGAQQVNSSSWNSIKPYVINNYTKGLLTAGIGAGMVFGGLKVLCNSEKVLGYLS